MLNFIVEMYQRLLIAILISAAAAFLISCSSKERSEGIAADYSYVLKNARREFSFTNKRSGYFLGEISGTNLNPYQGWTIDGKIILKDYQIFVGDDTLDRKNAEAFYFPHKLVRIFENADEEFFFADNIDLIKIQLTEFKQGNIYIRFDGIEKSSGFKFENNVVSFPNSPDSLLITSDRKIKFVNSTDESIELVLNESDSLSLFITANADEKHLKDYVDRWEEIYYTKLNLINDILDKSFVRTNISELNLALAWAKIHLNSLSAERDYSGIIAGLPSLDDFWGRDMLTSLPGAFLWTGDYIRAKEILDQMAGMQNNNYLDPAFGRVPNRFSKWTKIYDAADITSIFAVDALSYYRFSGDNKFLEQVFPAVKKSVEINIARNCDENNFLVHGADETWMNGTNQDGLITPRENRAVEIQVLWYKQLSAAIEMAQILKDNSADSWDGFRQKLAKDFQSGFIDKTRQMIIDKLTAENEPDTTLRPNSFFALNEGELIPDYKTRLELISKAFRDLVLPYGPVTVSLHSHMFHPYYENRPYYLKEDAQHNGLIWYWTFGKVISTLSGFGQSEHSWRLTSALVNQMSSSGIPGGIAEFSAPFAKSGKIKYRGAQIHAMALAEFVRNFYEDYLGVYVDAPENTLYLIPSLPEELSDVEFVQRIGDQFVRIKYQFNNLVQRVFISTEETFTSANIALSLTNLSDANYQLVIALIKGDEILVEIPTHSRKLNDLKLSRNGVIEQTAAQIYIDPEENKELYKTIQFAEAVLPQNHIANPEPDYKILTLEDIKLNADSAEIIVSKSDPGGDELYSYPKNKAFKKGILDITNLTLKADSLNYYFELKYKNLFDPGWRPEYGFQLTFTSILLRSPDFPKQSTDPSYNSKYLFQEDRRFNREIIIGGGLQILDASGKILAAYLPEEDDHDEPLGSERTKTISFSIPHQLLGEINPGTVISVLVGSQQDFGGAGIGKFREVNKSASEWNGGGKANPVSHNIYDFIFIN